MERLSDKLQNCISEGRMKYPDLNEDYITIVNGSSVTACIVEEIYEDGFRGHLPFTSFTVYYSWLPFATVTDDLAKRLRELEKEEKQKAN